MLVASPKTGTTWVQQIVHQLLQLPRQNPYLHVAGRDMDFGEVIEVIRVVNFAHDLRLDLEVKATSISSSLKKNLWGAEVRGTP